jgi:hypothetical protein
MSLVIQSIKLSKHVLEFGRKKQLRQIPSQNISNLAFFSTEETFSHIKVQFFGGTNILKVN